MTNIVKDMGIDTNEREWLKCDFESILAMYKDYEGSFIFAVRNTGADFKPLSIGETIKGMRDSQYEKYYYFHSAAEKPYLPIMSNSHYFLYTRGDELMVKINKDIATNTYYEMVTEAVEAFRILYPECKVVDRHVDVHFMDFGRVMEQIRYAQSIGNTSLINCIRHFHWYGRVNDEHEVRIFVEDAERHDLYFEVYIGGKYSSNGGIICHTYRDGKIEWSTHT